MEGGEDEYFTTYTGRVNKDCGRSKLDMLARDPFKCLIFVRRLTDRNNVEIGMKILSTTEMNQDLTLQKLSEECERILQVRHDTKEIQQKDCFPIKSVQKSWKTNKMFQEYQNKISGRRHVYCMLLNALK